MDPPKTPMPLPRLLSFPGEVEKCAEVAAVNKNELGFAVDLFRTWARVDLNPHIARWSREVESPVIGISLLLHLQAMRLYRSVIEDSARCEAVSGMALARIIFENTLALSFVSKPEVFIEAYQSKDNNGKLKWRAKPGTNNLDRGLRALLYIHSQDLAEQRLANMWKSKPDRAQIGTKYGALHGPHDAKDFAKSTIGAVWTEVLDNTHHYSGLKVEQLAKCLDPTLDLWYDVVYRMQSHTVHANDAHRQARVLADGRRGASIYSELREVRVALYTATGVFLANIAAINNHFGLGQTMDDTINELSRQFNVVFGTESNASAT
jgi:hypothetical protein